MEQSGKSSSSLAAVIFTAAIAGSVVSAGRAQNIRSGVDVVPLTVTVTDPQGKYVRGLTGADFAVFEDGVQQPLSFFASADVPVDVALVIDTSASMRDDLGIVQAAASGLIRALGPDDRGAVVSINENAGIPQPFTSDRARLERAVRTLTAAGGTALYDGLYIVLKEFQRERRDSPQVRRQVLVLLSDGLDTKSRLSFDDMLDTARRADVNVYVIALGRDTASAARFLGPGALLNASYAMNTVARDTGGQLFSPKSARELPQVYSTIAKEIESQYNLGYVPARPGSDGAFRRIVVRIASALNARARTRSGYYASGSPSSVSTRGR